MTTATSATVDARALAGHYIALWNEPDAARRTELLRSHWCEDAAYTDPLAAVRGHAQISALVGAVQERYPGFRFTLIGTPDAHGEHLRFSWTLGPQEARDLIQGTDFADLQGGKLRRVTGFLDKVPEGA